MAIPFPRVIDFLDFFFEGSSLLSPRSDPCSGEPHFGACFFEVTDGEGVSEALCTGDLVSVLEVDLGFFEGLATLSSGRSSGMAGPTLRVRGLRRVGVRDTLGLVVVLIRRMGGLGTV